MPTQEDGKRPGLLLPITFLSGVFFPGDRRGPWGELVALLGGVPSGKGRLPDGIVKRAGTRGPRWPSLLLLGSATAGRQGEEAAEETGSPPFAPSGSGSFRGSSPRLPSRCSVSAGPPRAAAASPAASSTGDTGLLVRRLVWFRCSEERGACYSRGSLGRRRQHVRSSAQRRPVFCGRRPVFCGRCSEVRPQRCLQLEECRF